ncbi:helix-turn-helix transcriptional regulator [Actinomadura rupiterrae]|uniref:helix-turn-helix transcriptional regulator n=1 Tax=Actinomadura rupiterrae TaxID=559627 RepID=UPI0027E2D6B5|nr:AAA family ATPase [Actinomadura rupiterrae]MCP2337094.1 ATP/maltotriose-dependent transcriptional regulator MalT [Actinomadura rupiterrae]
MRAHGTSPIMVGRAGQLDLLTEALAAAPGAVLVGGEAGLGKTRLIREFGPAVKDRARMLVGGCLELGSDGLPFAPFTTVLRGLVRDMGVDGVAELLPRGATSGLARLLPEFGEPETDAASGEERARLFETMLTLLEHLAERSPVVLVIEDAHWADRSTRDLLTFLVRNVGSAPLLIVVTYRSDELTRTHPLRPLLAELDRVERVRRLELPRLSRDEVGELVADILGRSPEPELIDTVCSRSEGNPLFVETLVGCDGRLVCELPETLRDLLLAGVQRLPEETQEALRDAAGGSTRIEHRLLAAVTKLDDAGLTRVLRPAVAANVLVVDGDGYAFRHALIREALHDDLLPGEHTRLHTRYAEALEDDPDLVPADRLWHELSHHWHAAHDALWALVASWKAAGEARRRVAYAECLDMLARVLELWDRVPEAAERIGAERIEVFEQAVAAAESAGELDRGVRFATGALRMLPDVPENAPRRAALLERRGRMLFDQTVPEAVDDLREAVRLLPAEPPTAQRARALNTLATVGRLLQNSEEPKRAAHEALAVARAVGDRTAEVEALLTLSCVDFDYGAGYGHDGSPTEQVLRNSQDLADQENDDRLRLRVAVNWSHFLEGCGRHAEAVEIARAGVQKAQANGVARTQGAFLAINQAEPLVSLGQWDEADALLRRTIEQRPPRKIRTSLYALAGEVAAARGDVEQACRMLAHAREVTWPKVQDLFATRRLEAALRLSQGRPEMVIAAVEPVLGDPDRTLPDDSRYAWPVLVHAATACAELGGTPDFERVEKRAQATTALGRLQEAWQLTYLATAARVRGDLNVEDWDRASAAWRELSNPYQEAQALSWAGQAALHAGDRDAARDRLSRATELARALRAVPLLDRLDALTQRARLGGTHADPAAAPFGLTPREFEVLRLVAEGHSNRDIAEALFISAKTASVHVSNILAKLDVASRGEAAATAHRLSLFTPAAP